MACDTDSRIDFDVSAPLLDWQQHSDSLPLMIADDLDGKTRRPKPKPRSKTPTKDANIGVKSKKQKWKAAKTGGTDGSDQEQLICDVTSDEIVDVSELRDLSSKSVNEDCDSQTKNDQPGDDTKGSPEMYMNTQSDVDETPYSKITDRHPVCSVDPYSTPDDEIQSKHDAKVMTKVNWAENEVARSLQAALDVISDKRSFLLDKLETLKKKKEEDEEKDREKSKLKTPIKVLKSPRASPVVTSESDTESESVFVRKKVIKTDKRKMELKLLAEIELIVSRAENISWTLRKVNYMTPFLVAKVAADVDTDEETPDLVDVMTVTISNTVVVMTTDFKNSCLKSFRHVPGEVVKSVLKFDNSPWGITRIDFETVAVSIPLASKLCLVDIRSELKLTETVKTKKQYYGLVSIGSCLLVATSPYSSPRTVDTIDLNGVVLKTLIIDALLQQPSFICDTPTGSFVVSDLSKGTLLGVSKSLEVASGFEHEGEARLQSTRGVATNRDGDVFVVDYQQKKVKVFSGEGRFLKDFLTPADGLKYPYGVCFDNRGHIYVTDGGVIKVFCY